MPETAESRCSTAEHFAAFFDVDDTLIRIKTMFSFLAHLKSDKELTNTPEFVDYETNLNSMMTSRVSREEVNRYYYRVLKGLHVDDVRKRADAWFFSLTDQKDIFNESVVRHLRWHQSMGHTVALVSGSCLALLQPIADFLHIKDIICAPLEVKDNHYTGRLFSSPTIGNGKALAMKTFAHKNDINLVGSYAYGDDVSDMQMLLAVGNPRLINPTQKMINLFNSSSAFDDRLAINF